MDPTMIKDVLQALAPLGPAIAAVGASVGVINLLSTRARFSQEKKQKILAVAQAIRSAVEATEAYLQLRASGEARDPAREQELSSLWKKAGLQLEQVAETDDEQRLSEKLRLKGFAWDYTGQWPDDRVLAHGIDFTTVKTELAQLERFLT